MLVVCPDCGADGQEAGKYCENCGRLLDMDGAQGTPGDSAQPAQTDPNQASVPAALPDALSPALAADTSAATTSPAQAGGTSAPASTPTSAPGASARFAVVHDGQASPAEGFTITRSGEFLVGRLDTETGVNVDIDLRQWVQPLDVDGHKQYLVHRHQCYLGLSDDGVVTIRPCPGAEADTLVKPSNGTGFTTLQQLATVSSPDSVQRYALQPGDRLYMGDPAALSDAEAGNPKAQGTYLILELQK